MSMRRCWARTVSPSSLRATRHQIYRDLHDGAADAIDRAQRLLEEMMTGRNFAEGVAAFTEKRPPAFADPRADEP